MKRTDIVNALIARGYDAEEVDSVKNKVTFRGILIRSDDQIAPVIYTQGLIEEAEKSGMPLSEVVSQVIRLYEENKRVDFCVDEIFDKDFVLSHIRIALQKESEQDFVKAPSGYDGIEKFLYVHGDTGYTVKLNNSFLERAGVSEEDAWTHAEENTFSETKICTMGQILSDLSGGYCEEEDVPSQMYAITNKTALLGASAVLDVNAIREYFSGSGITKLVVLPSSIHEMLLVPADNAPGMDEMNEMVKSINETQVRPEERLTDRAYIMEI